MKNIPALSLKGALAIASEISPQRIFFSLSLFFSFCKPAENVPWTKQKKKRRFKERERNAFRCERFYSYVTRISRPGAAFRGAAIMMAVVLRVFIIKTSSPAKVSNKCPFVFAPAPREVPAVSFQRLFS